MSLFTASDKVVVLSLLCATQGILLSGFMFPFDGMPLVARWFAELLPMTHFMRLIRGVVLRGADLWTLRGEMLALLVFAALAMTVAVKRFTKTLD